METNTAKHGREQEALDLPAPLLLGYMEGKEKEKRRDGGRGGRYRLEMAGRPGRRPGKRGVTGDDVVCLVVRGSAREGRGQEQEGW